MKKKKDKEDVEEEKGRDETSSEYQLYIKEVYKLLEPAFKMLEVGLRVKIVYFFRRNFYHIEKDIEIFEEKLRSISKSAECEFAYSLWDLWFLLGISATNFDIIHIFSSEKQSTPKSVIKFQEIYKNNEKLLKIHNTGSSLDGYASKVKNVLSSYLKNTKNENDSLLSYIDGNSIYWIISWKKKIISNKIWGIMWGWEKFIII